jgi:hypothetical protein
MSLVTVPTEHVEAYRHVLARLWLLNIPPQKPRADLAAARRLLRDQARLCDQLGPELAWAISQQAASHWAQQMGRCPWCGLPGVFHESEGADG